MLKNKLNLSNVKRRLKYRSVEFNLEPYMKRLKSIEGPYLSVHAVWKNQSCLQENLRIQELVAGS